MIRAVLPALCGIGLISVANAADLSPAYKAGTASAAVATTVANWTGLYIGGNIGYGWGKLTFANGGMRPSGINGGGQIGYNYQVDNFVLGIEGDFQGADHHDRSTSPIETEDMKFDWYATVRGRVGVAFGSFMPYVTGGVVFTQVKLNGVMPLFDITVSSSEGLTGYAVGAGVEYAISNNWSVKAEYMRLGFGSPAYNITYTGLGLAGPSTSTHKIETDFDIARAGLNYRF